jgi:hypothetical protein
LVTDLDVWRAANMLIKRHGAEAEIEAARLADAMLNRGDGQGHLLWLRIKRAIVDWQAPPAGTSH